YLTMKGSLGDPKKEINYRAFAGSALQGLSGLAGKNSGLLQGLGSALSGGSTAAPGTNQPGASTNRPANNPGGLVQGLLGGPQPTATNAPGVTNAAPATNQSPVDNLLNNLLKPKKK